MPKTSGPLPAEAAKSLHFHNLLDLSPPFPHSQRRVFCPGEQLPAPSAQALSSLLITICCYHSTRQGVPELPQSPPKIRIGIKCCLFLYCYLPHYHHQNQVWSQFPYPFPKKVLPPSQTVEGCQDFRLEPPLGSPSPSPGLGGWGREGR